MARKLTAPDLERFERVLRHMLSVLSGDIANLESETLSSSGSGAHSVDDIGGDVSSFELSLELMSNDEKAVGEIMEALDRIRDGSYGRCETCEKWIRKTRLVAVPHARNCIDCQRAVEAELT